MAFSSHEGSASSTGRMGGLEAELAGGDWAEPDKPQRDWKKLALVVGLGILSWVATYVGMLELIEANMGELPLVHKVIIAFSVAMLMTMIIWLLDQLFAPIGLFTKLIYAAGYVFLTAISVGFGFGFYWKVLESRSEASRSAESAVTQVQGSLHAAGTRLEQLNSTLIQLTQVSTQKAEVERTSGTSCPNSRPGDGPRRKLREDDAARFSFASEFVKGRVGQVKTDMSALDTDLARIAKDDKAMLDASGTRNEFMKSLSRKLDMTVTGFNAFRTDPQLKQIRADLAERAEKVTFLDTKGATYSCPDPQLQTALRGVVRAIDQLPELEKPKIAAVEGSEATIEAFRRLTATFYGMMSFKMPPSADELRQLQQKAVQSVEGGQQAQARTAAALNEQVGLSKRDYVPLAIALFVDLCLLLVSMGRPANRLGSLVPKMRAAERGPVYQILSKFSDIHKDKETREKFEIFRHVVFDFNGDYYVAVPLDAPYRMRGKRGEAGHGKDYTDRVNELQLEAHLLANLFSSFEKERIFTRVHSPFLTTGTIKRKLWRQGSKFAGSEAFRIYRFRDGAWSEIILGAVMGAARRVDAEKRWRRQQEVHTLRHGQHVQAAAPISPEQAAVARMMEAMRPQHESHAQAAAWPRSEHPTQPPYAVAASHGVPQTSGFGGHEPSHQQTQSGYAFGRVTTDSSALTGRTSPRTRHGDYDPADPATLAQKFGPYAASAAGDIRFDRDGRPRPAPSYRDRTAALDAVAAAREQVREAEVSVRAAANSNTAPPEPALREPAVRAAAQDMPTAIAAPTSSHQATPVVDPLPDNVVPLPRPLMRGEDTVSAQVASAPVTSAVVQPGGQTIDVTVRRETATFSLPVSEARLPSSLAGLLGQAVVTGQALRKPDIIDVDATPALPPALVNPVDQNAAEQPASAAAIASGNALVVMEPDAIVEDRRDQAQVFEAVVARRLAGEPAE